MFSAPFPCVLEKVRSDVREENVFSAIPVLFSLDHLTTLMVT